METLYQPEDAVEAAALEAALEEAGVRFVMRPHTGALGLAKTSASWGEILVHPDDLEEAQELVADWLESEVVDEEAGPYRIQAPEPRRPRAPKDAPPRPNLLPWALLLLALIGNLYQWVAWRDLGPATVAVDPEGRLMARYVYDDESGLPVRMTIFDKAGHVADRCRDGDVDGWFEHCEGTIVGREGSLESTDTNGDGRFDRTVVNDENGRWVWSDADGDGLFERSEDPYGGVGTDTDADGLVDRWTCASGASVSLLDCSVSE